MPEAKLTCEHCRDGFVALVRPSARPRRFCGKRCANAAQRGIDPKRAETSVRMLFPTIADVIRQVESEQAQAVAS